MTDIQQRTMSRESAERTATDFVNDFLTGAIEQARSLASMGDEEMFRGLDGKTVQYLRARIAESPEIKTTLRKAARLRAAQPATPPKRKPTFLYLMQVGSDGPVKIGVAVDVEARRRTLSTAAPLPLRVICALPESAHREREIHKRFDRFRMNGEWFEPIPEIFDWFRMEDI